MCAALGQVPRGAQVCSDDAAAALKFRFRTCWDVTLHPLELESSSLEAHQIPAQSSLVLQFSLTSGAKYDALTLDSLRLFLHEDSRHSRLLYHHLLRHVKEASAWGDQDETPVSVTIEPVGFEREDAVLLYRTGARRLPAAAGALWSSRRSSVLVDFSSGQLAGSQVNSFTVRIVFDTEPSQAMRVGRGDIRALLRARREPVPARERARLHGTKSSWPVRPQGRDQSRLDVAWIETLRCARGRPRRAAGAVVLLVRARRVPRGVRVLHRAPPARRRPRELPDVGDGRAARRPRARRARRRGVVRLMCTNGRAAARSTWVRSRARPTRARRSRRSRTSPSRRRRSSLRCASACSGGCCCC